MEHEVLLEISYSNLSRKADRYFGADRKNRASKVTVAHSVFIPYINDNYLEVEAETRTDNGKYITRIVFENVVFKNEEDNRTASIVAADGTEYFFNRINRTRSNVKVSCTCLDFHYRFASFNHKADALASDPPEPYVKKTDRPPVNPAKVPGLCKHIIRLVQELDKDNIFNDIFRG